MTISARQRATSESTLYRNDTHKRRAHTEAVADSQDERRPNGERKK